MIISSLPMCAVRADGLNFASLEASVQGERVSRNFVLTEFSEVRLNPMLRSSQVECIHEVTW
jgi:hypothetical protein